MAQRERRGRAKREDLAKLAKRWSLAGRGSVAVAACAIVAVLGCVGAIGSCATRGLVVERASAVEPAAAEGFEATYIRINDGSIRISATDDGINAARKSSAYTPTAEINGGEIAISMGAGDTDGVDSNGDLIISGGTISVTGNSAFDYDGAATYTGGTIIVNGQQVDSIPNQMKGGRGGMMSGDMMGGNPGMHGRKGW